MRTQEKRRGNQQWRVWCKECGGWEYQKQSGEYRRVSKVEDSHRSKMEQYAAVVDHFYTVLFSARCYSLLSSRLTALWSHVILNEWLAFYSAFWIATEVVYVQRCYTVSWYIYSREYLFCRMYSILCGIGSQWRAWNRKVLWSYGQFLSFSGWGK